MISFLHTLNLQRYNPRFYVIANTDFGSSSKATTFERSISELRNIKDGSSEMSFAIHYIPRSREVGESILSSTWSSLKALYSSIALVWKVRPDLVGDECSPIPIIYGKGFDLHFS